MLGSRARIAFLLAIVTGAIGIASATTICVPGRGRQQGQTGEEELPGPRLMSRW
jgi:hypothetical protein